MRWCNQVKRLPLFTFNTVSQVSLLNIQWTNYLNRICFLPNSCHIHRLDIHSCQLCWEIIPFRYYNQWHSIVIRRRERYVKKRRDILFHTFYCFCCVCKNGLIKTIRWNVNQIECVSKSRPETFQKHQPNRHLRYYGKR